MNNLIDLAFTSQTFYLNYIQPSIVQLFLSFMSPLSYGSKILFPLDVCKIGFIPYLPDLSKFNLFRVTCVQTNLLAKTSILTSIRRKSSFSWFIQGPRGHGGRVVTLLPPTSEARGSVPSTASSGKAGSCLLLVGSLQYRTLTNCLYWFPLPLQLPVVI